MQSLPGIFIGLHFTQNTTIQSNHVFKDVCHCHVMVNFRCILLPSCPSSSPGLPTASKFVQNNLYQACHDCLALSHESKPSLKNCAWLMICKGSKVLYASSFAKYTDPHSTSILALDIINTHSSDVCDLQILVGISKVSIQGAVFCTPGLLLFSLLNPRPVLIFTGAVNWQQVCTQPTSFVVFQYPLPLSKTPFANTRCSCQTTHNIIII